MIHVFHDDELNCRQVQLSDTLQRLWIEHVLWTRFFIVSNVFDLPDLQFVTNRLLQNPGDFGKVLVKFYGPQKVAQFEQLFTEHLLIAAALVMPQKPAICPKSKSKEYFGIKTQNKSLLS